MSSDGVTTLIPTGPKGGWVNVGLPSVHVALSERSWGGRIRRAWGILRGDSRGCLEFYSRETLETFIEAMNEALEVSFRAQKDGPTWVRSPVSKACQTPPETPKVPKIALSRNVKISKEMVH